MTTDHNFANGWRAAKAVAVFVVFVLTAGHCPAEDRRQRRELEETARELQKQFHVEWFEGNAEITQRDDLDIRIFHETDKVLDGLSKANASLLSLVSEISIYEPNAPIEKAAVLSQLPALKHFEIRQDEDSRTLKDWVRQLGQLQRLETFWCQSSGLDDECLRLISNCKSLTHVVIRDNPFTNNGIQYLTACENLKQLDLFHTAIDDSAIPQLAKLRKLTSLDIRATKISERGAEDLRNRLPKTAVSWRTDDKESKAELRYLQLRRLEKQLEKQLDVEPEEVYVTVQGNGITLQINKDTSKCLRQLWKVDEALKEEVDTIMICEPNASAKYGWVLANIPFLQSVHFGSNDKQSMMKEWAPHIGECFVLESFWSQSSGNIDDECLKHIAECTLLSCCMVENNPITNQGVEYLVGCERLFQLNLARTKIDDGAIPCLSQFTKLRTLWINETNITEKGYKLLEKQLPKTMVIWREKEKH